MYIYVYIYIYQQGMGADSGEGVGASARTLTSVAETTINTLMASRCPTTRLEASATVASPVASATVTLPRYFALQPHQSTQHTHHSRNRQWPATVTVQCGYDLDFLTERRRTVQ
jgi:hypothetical protein